MDIDRAGKGITSVNLGAEYDQVAIDAVRWGLREIGAHPVHSSWGVAGSQEVSHAEWRREADVLILVAETYMGLTLSGPEDVVETVAALVKDRLGG